MHVLFLVIVLATAGCQSHQLARETGTSPDPSEIEVLVAVLAGHYDECVKSNTRLVILDRFYNFWFENLDEKTLRELFRDDSKRIPADLIRDFREKNANRQQVWPALQKQLPVTLVREETLERLFAAQQGQKPDGWDKFHAKYPKSPGIITISRVGFDSRRDTAMVYLGCQSDWLQGSGFILLLRKIDGKWIEDRDFYGPLWIS